MSTPSIAENFNRYFAVVFADTSTLKQEVYRLRYRVYCEEFGYEDPQRFPKQQECDEFDAYSYHGMIVHRDTGRLASCFRLVPALPGIGLPFQKFCNGIIDTKRLSSLELNDTMTCEISRLAVDKQFRRRRGEASSRFGQTDRMSFSSEQRRSLQLIALSSFLASVALTDLTKRRNAFAMMEPFLPRLLKDAGIPFFKIGRDIDYHGCRALYYTRTEIALINIRADLRDLYDAIYISLAPYFVTESHHVVSSHHFLTSQQP